MSAREVFLFLTVTPKCLSRSMFWWAIGDGTFVICVASLIYAFMPRSISTGSQKKSDIMQREDDAMWIEDPDDKPSGGGGFWNPFAIAKGLDDADQVAARKARSNTPPPAPAPPEPKKSGGGFKFPWDK